LINVEKNRFTGNHSFVITLRKISGARTVEHSKLPLDNYSLVLVPDDIQV
jgi:hypothetical protein